MKIKWEDYFHSLTRYWGRGREYYQAESIVFEHNNDSHHFIIEGDTIQEAMREFKKTIKEVLSE